MKISILRSARADIHAGYQFYEDRQEGLGDYFLTSIESDLRSLNIFAGVHEMIDGHFRMVASRFPFSIFYKIENSEVRIAAVLDNRRNPKLVSDRLN